MIGKWQASNLDFSSFAFHTPQTGLLVRPTSRHGDWSASNSSKRDARNRIILRRTNGDPVVRRKEYSGLSAASVHYTKYEIRYTNPNARTQILGSSSHWADCWARGLCLRMNAA